MKNKILAFLLLSLTFGVAKAQYNFDYANPKEYEIAEISISGVKYLNENTLKQISGLSVGQKIYIPGDDIRNVIVKFWKQGLFSDVQIFADSIIENKVYLNIFLLERPRLSRYEFTGIKNSEAKELDEKVGLIRGNQVTDNTINNAQNAIKTYFVDKGFYKTKISFRQEDDTVLLNTVVLFFDIEKDEKIKINDITVEGNTVFSDKKIRRYLKETKKKRWYGLFKPSKYIPANYSEDIKTLIAKYNKNGYRDARIVSATIYDFDANTLNIHLEIEEGNQYFFRNITWVGNTKYPSETLGRI